MLNEELYVSDLTNNKVQMMSSSFYFDKEGLESTNM